MKSDHATQAEWIGAVMEKHAGSLTRYATAILGDADRARDVVQDTLTRLCREDREKIAPYLAEWLFTVCRRRALDVLRKETRMTSLSQTDWEHRPGAEPSPAHEAEWRDTHDHVLRALATLPQNQQEVVRLKFQNGLSYEEISRVTQLTVSNVGFLIHTAIKNIRQRLQKIDAPWPQQTARRTP